MINEYVIMPESVTDADGNVFNPKVGEKIGIVKRYETTAFPLRRRQNDLTPVNDDNIKIVIASHKDDETGKLQYDYDAEGWKWIEVSGQELPILERITEDNTNFALAAMEKDTNGEWVPDRKT